MEQRTLFHEDINDALRAAVKACNGTKAVAMKLWPEKPMTEAQSYLNDCLNPARNAKLSPEQVLLLLRWAKEAGCHDAINYICDEVGYGRPKPIEPEDELTRLLRRYLDAKAELGATEPKIEELRAKLRAA
jgi:hypothetical protein